MEPGVSPEKPGPSLVAANGRDEACDPARHRAECGLAWRRFRSGYAFSMKSGRIVAGLVALSQFACGLGGASAQTYLVDWSGDYLDQPAGGQRLELGPDTPVHDAAGTPVGVGFPSSDEAPKSPASARYQSGMSSALFYGALEFTNPGSADSGDLAPKVRPLNAVVKVPTGTFIGLGGTPPVDGSVSRIRGVLYWQKKDFLSGFAAARTVTWSDIVGLSVNILKIDAKNTHARFAVRSGGKWYLSESRTDRTKQFVVNDTVWGEWTGFGETMPLPPAPDQFTVQASALNEITALGIYFDAASTSPGSNAAFGFNAFRAEAHGAPSAGK